MREATLSGEFERLARGTRVVGGTFIDLLWVCVVFARVERVPAVFGLLAIGSLRVVVAVVEVDERATEPRGRRVLAGSHDRVAARRACAFLSSRPSPSSLVRYRSRDTQDISSSYVMPAKISPNRRRSIAVLNQGTAATSTRATHRRRAYSIVPGEKLSPAARARTLVRLMHTSSHC